MFKRVERWISRIVSDELKDYISSRSFDLYLYEMGILIGKKMDYPSVPPIGGTIVIKDGGELFKIQDIQMSESGFIANLYGKIIPNEYPLHS